MLPKRSIHIMKKKIFEYWEFIILKLVDCKNRPIIQGETTGLL